MGPSAAGKTSILIRIEHNSFEADSHSTLTAAFLSKYLIHKGVEITLSFWDTAGQERYNSISASYFRNA